MCAEMVWSCVDLLDVFLQCRGDAGVLGCGCFELDGESGILGSLGSVYAEGGDGYVALLEVGEVLEQGRDATGAEEDEHVVVEGFALGKVVAHGAVHHTLGELEFLTFEEVLDFIAVDVAHWHEISFLLVLDHGGQEVVDFSGVAEEHFALAVLNVLLYVESHGLGDAEVFHILGDGDSQLFAKVEEVVDGMARGEYDGCVLEDVNLLSTKLARGEAFDFDEGAEDNLYTILSFDVEIG